MSATTFIAGSFGKPLSTLRKLATDPDLLAKTAARHGISTEWASEYLAREIAAKEAGL